MKMALLWIIFVEPEVWMRKSNAKMMWNDERLVHFLVQFLHDYLFYEFAQKLFGRKLFMQKYSCEWFSCKFHAKIMQILHQNLHDFCTKFAQKPFAWIFFLPYNFHANFYEINKINSRAKMLQKMHNFCMILDVFCMKFI